MMTTAPFLHTTIAASPDLSRRMTKAVKGTRAAKAAVVLAVVTAPIAALMMKNGMSASPGIAVGPAREWSDLWWPIVLLAVLAIVSLGVILIVPGRTFARLLPTGRRVDGRFGPHRLEITYADFSQTVERADITAVDVAHGILLVRNTDRRNTMLLPQELVPPVVAHELLRYPGRR